MATKQPTLSGGSYAAPKTSTGPSLGPKTPTAADEAMRAANMATMQARIAAQGTTPPYTYSSGANGISPFSPSGQVGSGGSYGATPTAPVPSSGSTYTQGPTYTLAQKAAMGGYSPAAPTSPVSTPSANPTFPTGPSMTGGYGAGAAIDPQQMYAQNLAHPAGQMNDVASLLQRWLAQQQGGAPSQSPYTQFLASLAALK